jgi:hypothetical protein
MDNGKDKETRMRRLEGVTFLLEGRLGLTKC